MTQPRHGSECHEKHLGLAVDLNNARLIDNYIDNLHIRVEGNELLHVLGGIISTVLQNFVLIM